jgi:hypothetical protein
MKYWLEIIGNIIGIAFGILILVNLGMMWNGGIIRWHEPSQAILILEIIGALVLIGIVVYNLIKDIPEIPPRTGSKSFWKSKSFWVGVAICLSGIVEFLLGIDPNASVWTIITGVVMVIVRFVTKDKIK